jgi:hypothetical protein
MAAKFSTNFGSVNSLPAGWHNVPCQGKFNYGKSGSTEMVIGGKGDCPTIETDDYVLFGYFEAKIRAAPGKGVVSSIVMQSDVRDEVDWVGRRTRQLSRHQLLMRATGIPRR